MVLDHGLSVALRRWGHSVVESQSGAVNAALSALVEAGRAGKLVIFCGAGVSMLAPSRSPNWWEIYHAAARALLVETEQGFGDQLPAIDLDGVLGSIRTQQLADLIVSRFAGETFTELLSAVDIADPNANHRLISALAGAGHVRGVLTTNFDTMIERAAATYGVGVSVCVPYLPPESTGSEGLTLIKIHGSVAIPGSLIETSSHKARAFSPVLKQCWLPMLDDAVVLVLGYSGADLGDGAAGAFFEDVLARRCPIYWGHRPGSRPELPAPVAQQVVFIEGGLPHPLDAISDGLGVSDFETPVTGRDAHARLAASMREWAASLHVGRWGAATLFQELARQHGHTELAEALRRIAMAQAERLQPGAALEIADLASSALLRSVATHAMAQAAFEDAATLLHASQRIQVTFDQALQNTSPAGRKERLANLAGGWNNLAFCSLVAGNKTEAVSLYREALGSALAGGHAALALIAITNMLGNGDELNRVRVSMRLAEVAVDLADRIGALGPSVELRLLLAMYAFDRNEPWVADEWLIAADRRARVVDDEQLLSMVDILMAESELRKGRIEAGLNRIAARLERTGQAAFMVRPIEETRRHLVILGVPSPGSFFLHLPQDAVDGHVARLQRDRDEAGGKGELPWRGAHLAVSDSAVHDEGQLGLLCRLGQLTFDGEDSKAADLGLHFAFRALSRGHLEQAHWAARNVVAGRPAPIVRAAALGVLGAVAAERGEIVNAARLFDQAEQAHRDAETPPSAGLASSALWFFVQAGDVAKALAWVRLWPLDRAKAGEAIGSLYAEAMRLDTWGEAMADVAAALREKLAPFGGVVPVGQSGGDEPVRRYVGIPTPLDAEDQALMHRLHALAVSPDPITDLPDFIPEVILSAGASDPQRLQALDIWFKSLSEHHPLAEVEAMADNLRAALLGDLNFNGVVRLETHLWLLRCENGQIDQAQARLRDVIWIADLATLPLVRAEFLSLAIVDANMAALEQVQEASATLRYFGRRTAAPVKPEPVINVGEAFAAFAVELAATSEPDAADALVREVVIRLRRARCLTADLVGRVRGERANWDLNHKRFVEAAEAYRRIERGFFRRGEVVNALNSRAGAARAMSRSGDFAAAEALFKAAVADAEGTPMVSNLLRGLGAARLVEATERRDPMDLVLLEQAVQAFKDAIKAGREDTMDRARARLALARAFGERGDQEEAMASFDEAISELSHLGGDTPRLLITHRTQFAEGNWRGLGMF
ncbi:SIR2 family protein [Brevundimonas sp.]|uniref:SIR2 family protein n=1 Tax=Brevundimonas sp. TaxID=1871086 RepID=UPI003F6F8181